MDESRIIQGRQFGPAELEQVRQGLAAHPDWNRQRLSIHLATLWNWRNPAGRLKDMAARTFLLKLERRALITLPPRQSAPRQRPRSKRLPGMEIPLRESDLSAPLRDLLPLSILEVSAPAGRLHRPLFAGLLQQHHYLSYHRPVGQNLQYLVRDRQGRSVACVLFGAAAWQCADRDRQIGWDAPTRARHLHFLANNARFLVPPWIRVAHLASHVLSRVAQRLSRDWQGKYGHPIYLLETFVQTDRFAGACYRAANWARVGQTKGRSRQDRADGTHHRVPVKDVYLLPLHPGFRELLQGSAFPQTPPQTSPKIP